MLLAMVGDIRVLFVKLADRTFTQYAYAASICPPKAGRRIYSRDFGDLCSLGTPPWHGQDSRRTGGPCLQASFDPAGYQNTVALDKARRAISRDFIEETKRAIETRTGRTTASPPDWRAAIKRIYGRLQQDAPPEASVYEVFDFIAIRVLRTRSRTLPDTGNPAQPLEAGPGAYQGLHCDTAS